MSINIEKFRKSTDIVLLQLDDGCSIGISTNVAKSAGWKLNGAMKFEVALDHLRKSILVRQVQPTAKDKCADAFEAYIGHTKETLWVIWNDLPRDVNRAVRGGAPDDDYELEPGVGIVIPLPERFFTNN